MKKKPDSKSYSELMANLARNVSATIALLPKLESLGKITWQSLSRKICAGPSTFANIRLGIDAEEQDQRVRLRTIHDIAQFFDMSVADFVRPYPEGLGGTTSSPQEASSHAGNLCVDLLVLKRNLKEARKALGWSQPKMALEVGVSVPTLRNWETEDPTIQPCPSIPQLNRIAQATAYSVASLLGISTKI